MTKTITCPHCGFEGPILSFDDALSQDAWRNAVSDGETTLGFADWLVEQMQNALAEMAGDEVAEENAPAQAEAS